METYRVKSKCKEDFLSGVKFDVLKCGDLLKVSEGGFLGIGARRYRLQVGEKTDTKIKAIRNSGQEVVICYYEASLQKKWLRKYSIDRQVKPEDEEYHSIMKNLGRML